jgi:hypothetical protein
MFELFSAPSESLTHRRPVGPGNGAIVLDPSSSTPDVVPTAASSKISSIASGVSPAVPFDANSPSRCSSGIDVVIEGAAKNEAFAVKCPFALSIVAAVAAPR